MGNRSLYLLGLVVCCLLVVNASGYVDEARWEEGGEGWWEGSHGRRGAPEGFVMQHAKHVVQTDAGNMKIVKSHGGRFVQNPMHIGFITMEPRSLFIPQYLDSSLILFVHQGHAKVGHIFKDQLVEKKLKSGDIYAINAGSAFYLINTAESQRLHVVCSIDESESLNWHAFQSFLIGGGTYPTSVLSGFDSQTLSAAFNVTEQELSEMLTKQREGPIVFLSNSHSPSMWTKFVDQEQHQRLAHMRRVAHVSKQHVKEDEDDEAEKEQETEPKWSVRKFLTALLGEENKKKEDAELSRKKPHSYNIYKKKPNFKNNYGWSTGVGESQYSPLKHIDVGVYLVNLTAGSMMAPHVNPRATEYGVVLRGSGSIQIVYPNGSLAMNCKVNEGDVFWIPRYFPFCQIASHDSQLELFGFTTSARHNRPQVLAGANSLLKRLEGPELATAFGVSENRLKKILNAQSESVILPWSNNEQPKQRARPSEKDRGEIRKMVLGNDMVVGFD